VCEYRAVSPEVALEAVLTVAALDLSRPLAVISTIILVTSVPSAVEDVPRAIDAKAVPDLPVNNFAVSTKPYLVTTATLVTSFCYFS
jgi:hypothetical protein